LERISKKKKGKASKNAMKKKWHGNAKQEGESNAVVPGC